MNHRAAHRSRALPRAPAAGRSHGATDRPGHSPDVADILESWFAGSLGPNLGAVPQSLRVTAQDDHFRVTLPFADATGDNEVAADIRPLDGGRWSVDALHLPAASRFTLQMPEPGGPPGVKVPTVFALSIGTQDPTPCSIRHSPARLASMSISAMSGC